MICSFLLLMPTASIVISITYRAVFDLFRYGHSITEGRSHFEIQGSVGGQVL